MGEKRKHVIVTSSLVSVIMPKVPEEVTLFNNKQFGCGIVGHYVFSEIPDQFLEARSNSVFFKISLKFFLCINFN